MQNRRHLKIEGNHGGAGLEAEKLLGRFLTMLRKRDLNAIGWSVALDRSWDVFASILPCVTCLLDLV